MLLQVKEKEELMDMKMNLLADITKSLKSVHK